MESREEKIKIRDDDDIIKEHQQLSPLALRSAESHAAFLKAGGASNVCQQLQLLFEAVGLHALNQASPKLSECLQLSLSGGGEEPPSSSASCCSYAPAYACAVLESASKGLTLQIGERALEALAEASAVKTFAPSLRRRVLGKLESIRSTRLRYKNFYDEVPQGQGNGAPAYLRRPMVLPGGETRPLNMSSEEAKRLKNREEARDAFVNLLGNLQDFLSRNELLNSKIDRSLNQHGGFGRKGGGGGGGGYDDYEALHGRVRSFVCTLRLDNIQWFSELFMERILQTASMGEMDEEVVVLANADPSKMRRLHQRMTVPHNARGKNQRGATFGIHPDYPRNSSNPKSEHNYFSSSSRGQGQQHQQQQHHHQQRFLSQLNGANGMELIRTSLIKFPTNLRIYVLFLLIADSQRLNQQLETKMVRRILETATWLSSSPLPSDLSERVLSCKSLALFLGYFAFCAKDKACQVPNEAILSAQREEEKKDELATFLKHASLLDVRRLLQSSLKLGTLPFTLPWLSDYLKFGRYAESSCNEELRYILAQLWHLRSALALSNSEKGFSTATLCMTICIDLLFEEWGIDVRDESVAILFQGLKDASTPFADMNIDLANKFMDQKCIQACCPELDELAGFLGETFLSATSIKKSLRKITPISPATSKPKTSDPSKFSIDGNSKLRAALLGDTQSEIPRDKVLTLQRAMLDRYPELKNVIDFVVGAVSRNAIHEILSSKVREEITKMLSLSENGSDARQQFTDEDYVSECCHSIAILSFKEIRWYLRGKVPTALNALMPANIDRQVAKCASEIGMEASLITAAKGLLDRIPLEFHKSVRERIKAPVEGARGDLSKPSEMHEATGSDIGSQGLFLRAIHATEALELDKVADIEQKSGKIYNTILGINADVEMVKAKLFPLVPRVQTYHSFWKRRVEEPSLPKCLELLGYVWCDLTLLLDESSLLEERAAEMIACLKQCVFDQLNLGSNQPLVRFGFGLVGRFADHCSFCGDGLIEMQTLGLAEHRLVRLVSSLLDSSLMHPRDLQELLLQLLDYPVTFLQYRRVKEQSDRKLHESLASKCLERSMSSHNSVYYAQIIARLNLESKNNVTILYNTKEIKL